MRTGCGPALWLSLWPAHLCRSVIAVAGQHHKFQRWPAHARRALGGALAATFTLALHSPLTQSCAYSLPFVLASAAVPALTVAFSLALVSFEELVAEQTPGGLNEQVLHAKWTRWGVCVKLTVTVSP